MKQQLVASEQNLGETMTRLNEIKLELDDKIAQIESWGAMLKN